MEIVLDRINKSFGEKHVLKDLSFTAKSGGAFGLLGRNGSGKTTTIRVIMRMFFQDSGHVRINGRPNSEFKGKIGYLPEERGLYPKRIVSEQMIYIGELRGLKYAEAKKRSLYLLEKFQAEEYYKKRLDTLSKGNQQKIQLAIAMINDPDIVILDEPFSGLDPVNAQLLEEAVREAVKGGKTVLFSSHQMNQVEAFCQDICIIDDGKTILDGNLKAIKRSYPRNKIRVSVYENVAQRFLELTEKMSDVVASASKEYIGNECTGVLVTLKTEKDKSALLNHIASSQIPVDGFSVVEPSLTDIFIEKVGKSVGNV